MGDSPFGIFLLGMLVVGVVVAAAFYFDYKRREMWRQVAARYGFEYSADDPYGLPERYKFALFQQGHSRKARNCLEGTYERLPVILFDYRYVTGSGKNRQTHNVSGLIAGVDICCAHLVIRPEGVMDKVAAFLGFDDIDFEYDQFNCAFHVKCEDKKFAYDICHSGMMDYLLGHRSMTWELRGRDLLLYSWRMGTFNPGEIDRCLEAARGFAERIPDYLAKEARS